MSKRALSLAVIYLIALWSPAYSKPTFDCNATSKPDDIAICSDANLTSLEITSAIMLRYSRSLLGKEATLLMGRELMKERRSCGSNRSCLERVFTKSIKSFKDIINSQYDYQDLN